ncbi:MAG: hypothetical protein EVJ48_03110 [Candidatus Acidulodesulfobacterium acidiphilum]|uniref:Uncharacterized protein n=1 Tax=Candidatus Acidulodesulfobacterium acidiphilum TaxID=2597224 RepID=A0A520XFK1_9DELT|nr:MAG: hypothetical protein EVJ48_03110 [Candidatus Acidulodesulfobacterium acidiphilum]
MSCGNCRGDKNKENLTKLYLIKPLTHLKLNKGQVEKCCCGDKINDNDSNSECYIFSCTSKTGNQPIPSTFFAGMGCSAKILEMTYAHKLPVFNPFEEESESEYEIDTSNGGSSQNIAKVKWDPLNKELYKAINILILSWNIRDLSKYSTIVKILSFLESKKEIRTYKWAVEAINTMIAKDKKKRKIKDMLKDLGYKTKNIKFPEIGDLLKAENIGNNFE